MKLKILISILAMVLVAGCVVPGLEIPGVGITPGLAGIGLEIISFSADPSPVYSRGTIRVVAEVENRGGSTVDNDSALVYLTGSNIDLDDLTGRYWYGRDTDDRSEIMWFSKDMDPENVVRGTPADTERFSWTLVAPNITPGQTRQDTFIFRVYTEYSSGVNGNIWVYTDAEAEATKAAGRSLKTSSFTPVSGPVAVSINLRPNPIILYEGEDQFTFNIDVTNTAAGTIYKNNSIPYTTATASDLALDAESELNWLSVDVDTDLIITECTGDQEIFGGRSMTMVCEATIPSGQPVDTFRSYLLNVIVSYGYYTEREAAVTVQGR